MKAINTIRYCTQSGCNTKIIFMFNVESSKYVPVDYESLSTDEQNVVEGNVALVDTDVDVEKVLADQTRFYLCYNKAHHTSHFKTCINPNRYSRRKPK